MIPYSDFRRLLTDAAECTTLDQYMAECGGSVPVDDVDAAIDILKTLYALGHEGLTFRRIAEVFDVPMRQIGIRYGIPQRTLENWAACTTPSSWSLPLIAYAVMTDELDAHG